MGALIGCLFFLAVLCGLGYVFEGRDFDEESFYQVGRALGLEPDYDEWED